MTHWIDTQDDFVSPERGGLARKVFSCTVPGAVTLVLSGLFGVWTLYTRPPIPPQAVQSPGENPVKIAAIRPKSAAIHNAAQSPYGALFDPRFVSDSPLIPPGEVFALEASPEPESQAPSMASAEAENAGTKVAAAPQLAENVPLPVARPPELKKMEARGENPALSRRLAQQDRRAAPPAAAPDNRSFFEKLFGLNQPAAPALAYAAPESSVITGTRSLTSNPPSRYDRWTAVYDVSAHTVYLPNGTRLEAHSGLGSRMDDPRYVHERMRGATPPNIYELRPREALFHGVPALRLIPIGNGELYGRTGLLAHTYMLGPNGESNGCVSFRNYNAFLQAYQNGEIKRLAVVARLN